MVHLQDVHEGSRKYQGLAHYSQLIDGSNPPWVPKIQRQIPNMTRICGLLILTYTAYPHCVLYHAQLVITVITPCRSAFGSPSGTRGVHDHGNILRIGAAQLLLGPRGSWRGMVQCARTLQVGELVHSQILHQDSVWPSAMVLWCSPGSLAEDSWSVLV